MIEPELDSQFQDATSLRDAGDLPGAKKILDRLSVEYPQRFGVWLVLGGVEMDLKDYEAAERALTTATALAPQSEIASLALFLTLKDLGRINEAFTEMRRFLALRPESRQYELLREELDEAGYH
ncbi:MAG TPA: tetratricopeptide repeat protein [Thermoanaerobaculia bacterium]|jgi:tetratricopeptide (TPR) repeat protein|nr:tetratricopeptide repeat protein [Thermoanaerobaculia bacterium]